MGREDKAGNRATDQASEGDWGGTQGVEGYLSRGMPAKKGDPR